jgi:hypothetical protein
MSEGRKFLKQAAMQIGAGGSAGRYKKKCMFIRNFVSTFNYTFRTQPDDISFKPVLVTCSKFCIFDWTGSGHHPCLVL